MNIFYRVSPAPTDDFIVKTDWAATQLQLNHAQLVCALGFNGHMRGLSDILSIVGFSSYEQLAARRDELFTTDTYDHLSIDNILDIYSERPEEIDLLATLRELLPARLAQLEQLIGRTDNPNYVICYKMEVHAIYNGGIATADFARARLGADIGEYRLVSEEAQLVAETALLSPSSIMFMASVLPEEKRLLIEKGFMPAEVIRRRLVGQGVTHEEKEMLQAYLA